MKTLFKDDKEIKYLVIKTNNKHSYLKPKEGYLEIHLGKSGDLKYILNKIKEDVDKYLIKSQTLSDDVVLLWGTKYQLELVEGEFSYYTKNNKIFVSCPLNVDYKQTIYLRELSNYINSIKTDVIKTINKENIYWVSIKYKKLKSKYGSYHIKKNEITLNILLAQLDKEFTNYVLMHEFTHQKIHNHQKEFYDLLGKLYPNYINIVKKLKKEILYF